MIVPDDLTRPADPNAPDFSGITVGPYRLIREIGSGGMGTVFLAVRNDDAFQRRVAIKVLRRQEVASDFAGLATAQAKSGDRSAALDSHSRAINLSRDLSKSDPTNIELQIALALIARAETYRRFKNAAESITDYSEAIRILEALHEAGSIEGTDQKTLDDARAALAKLRTG